MVVLACSYLTNADSEIYAETNKWRKNVPGRRSRWCRRSGRGISRGRARPWQGRPSWQAGRCRGAAGSPISQATAPTSPWSCVNLQSKIPNRNKNKKLNHHLFSETKFDQVRNGEHITYPEAYGLSAAPASPLRSCTRRSWWCRFLTWRTRGRCIQKTRPPQPKPGTFSIAENFLQTKQQQLLARGWRWRRFVTSRSGFGDRAARPQSDRCGLYSSSSRMFEDLKLLWTTGGMHTSCRYLKKLNVRMQQITKTAWAPRSIEHGLKNVGDCSGAEHTQERGRCRARSSHGCSMWVSCSFHLRSAVYRAASRLQCTRRQEAFAHVRCSSLQEARCLDVWGVRCWKSPRGNFLLRTEIVRRCQSSWQQAPAITKRNSVSESRWNKKK